MQHANWQAYQVILRLHSPLHIGWGRVSYLQRARPYITGRVLRGALVSRVGRNSPNLLSKEPLDPYRRVSKTLAAYLAFTYFYPALQDGEKWKVCFPWDDEPAFRRRFLSSYVAAALEYPAQTAAEGLLYETEFIAPYTLDEGKPVYLMGYIFVDETHLKRERYDWVSALRRLQLGGERGYGWGEARLADIHQFSGDDKLFGCEKIKISFNLDGKRPIVHLEKDQPVLAHTDAKTGDIAGAIEPLIGREWRADNQKHPDRRHVGQHLAFNDLRFAPGSIVLRDTLEFVIGEGGYWQPIPPREGAPQ